MNPRMLFAKRLPYLAWAAVSACWLAAASFIDPYVLGISCYGTGLVSAVLILAALAFSPRSAGWALLGAVPSGLAVALLSTYRWG